MENRDWLNDYMSLKQVNPVNPFLVPDGYFDNLLNHITCHKTLIDIKNDNLLAGYTLPENYFEELSVNIQSRITIENKLNVGNAGFITPPDYFNTLEQQIKSRALVEEAAGAPDQYFTVPQGYFEKLNENILNNTIYVNKSKRTGVIRKLYASTAIKYATAACFALVIGGGILLNKLSNPINDHKNSFLHKQLSDVPVDDIQSYLQLNDDAGDTQQVVAAEGAPVDDNQLKNALQNDVDSGK